MARVRTGTRKTTGKEATKSSAEGNRKPLAADPVFTSLAGAILRGKFEPGSALPPERELAALFNVSRLIVRQALHRLREVGLVHGGQGGQTTVLDPDDASDPRIISLTMQLAPKPRDEQDVLERQLIGGAMIFELVRHRIAEEQIEALSQRLKAVKLTEGMTDRESAEFEAEWWTHLAEISQNRILVRETRWWFEIVKEQPERYARIHGSLALPFRLAAYQEVLEGMRKQENVTRNYLATVRPLFALRREDV